MKIIPVILSGGAGTSLWPKSKKNMPKQFIDFGGWTLFQKTLERINNPFFDFPIISTNISYLNLVRRYLSKYKMKKYKILLEPVKKNTSAAILSSVLLDEIPFEQPMIFFPADHLIEEVRQLNKAIISNKKYLDEDNISIFGIKPNLPSSQYGYFLTKKTSKGFSKVSKFIDERLLRKSNPSIPYVGESAFAHKGGLHASGIKKHVKTYEHIDPEIVGNKRNIKIYDQAG